MNKQPGIDHFQSILNLLKKNLFDEPEIGIIKLDSLKIQHGPMLFD